MAITGIHVAGIIGMNQAQPSVLRGVAPGVAIRSYPVFPDTGEGATNYDIMSAIDRAVEDGCHILNLSLGGGDADEATRAAVGHAAESGVLVIAAAGNDGRKAVSYPAAFPTAVAVSAMGRRGTFPDEFSETGDVAKPFGQSADEFVAAFSNIGPQISFAGPGVGVVSTVPTSAWGINERYFDGQPGRSRICGTYLVATPRYPRYGGGKSNQGVAASP